MKATIISIVIITVTMLVYFGGKTLLRFKKMNRGFFDIKTLNIRNVITLDSVPLKLNDSKIVLIHFRSTCESCQYELKEIRDRIDEFENSEVIFLSTESIFEMRMTSEDYGFDSYKNVHFASINPKHLLENFGKLSVPHIFIYGRDRKLNKEFKGETKIEAILKYVRE